MDLDVHWAGAVHPLKIEAGKLLDLPLHMYRLNHHLIVLGIETASANQPWLLLVLIRRHGRLSKLGAYPQAELADPTHLHSSTRAKWDMLGRHPNWLAMNDIIDRTYRFSYRSNRFLLQKQRIVLQKDEQRYFHELDAPSRRSHLQR